MDWLWTLTSCGFQAFGPAVMSETTWPEKNQEHSLILMFDCKKIIIINSDAVNFYVCILHLRRMLKGERFKCKTACHWRGITFLLYSEQGTASDLNFRESNDDREITLSSCQKAASFHCYPGAPSCSPCPRPCPNNLLCSCWRQVEQVVTQG